MENDNEWIETAKRRPPDLMEVEIETVNGIIRGRKNGRGDWINQYGREIESPIRWRFIPCGLFPFGS